MNISPYKNSIDNDYINAEHVQIRWQKTLAFLKKNEDIKSALEIGDRSPLTESLESFYKCNFDSTYIDLDTGHLSGKYDLIMAFEIIEHLFNPLHLLLEVRKILNEDGILYLSTPLGKPYFLWSNDHFHEIGFTRLKSLLDRAGFRIICMEKIRIQPLAFYFTGIRPMLRFIFEKHILLRLSPH